MDQQKIGGFLRELRNGQGLTQERLAEMLGVSNRSVSRWENGRNMPDFDLLMQLARQYGVTVEEILDGERSAVAATEEPEAAMQKVADYGNLEKLHFSRHVRFFYLAALVAIAICAAIDLLELRDVWIFSHIAEFMLGLVFGMTLVGLLYTSRFMAKCREFKEKLLKKREPGFD